MWSECVGEAFSDLLLSPTVDTIDQQLLVSAVTLSLLKTFDYQKLRVLMMVYKRTTDERVRQRALVGWALCIDSSQLTIYPEMPYTAATIDRGRTLSTRVEGITDATGVLSES
jgi:hypothetical protein